MDSLLKKGVHCQFEGLARRYKMERENQAKLLP